MDKDSNMECEGVICGEKRKVIKALSKIQNMDLVCQWETKLQVASKGIMRSLGPTDLGSGWLGMLRELLATSSIFG